MFRNLSRPKKILIALLILTFVLRVFRIDYPSKYVFDEVYHGFTAQEYVKNNRDAWVYWSSAPQGVAYEWTHPPLAKEIMAFSMMVLGTTDPWAYRLPGVIFGTISVLMVYFITKELFKKEWLAVLAAFIFSLDGLNFVQSRTGMNDIYLVTFMLCSFFYFLRKRYIISATFLGLAVASKWTALYYFGFIILLFLIQKFNQIIKDKYWHHIIIGFLFILVLLQSLLFGYSLHYAIGILTFALAVAFLYFIKSKPKFLLIGLLIFIISSSTTIGFLYQEYLQDPTISATKKMRINDADQTIPTDKTLFTFSNHLRGQLVTTYISPIFQNITNLLIVYTILAVLLLAIPKFRNVSYFLVIPPLIYFLSYYPIFKYNYTDVRPNETNFKHFVDVQKQMWWYHTGLKANHDYASKWWTWPFNFYPVWYDVQYINQPDPIDNQMSTTFAAGNPVIFWMGFVAIILTTLQLVNKAVKIWLLLLVGLLFVGLLGYTNYQNSSWYTGANTFLANTFRGLAIFEHNLKLPAFTFLLISLTSVAAALVCLIRKKYMPLAICLLAYFVFLLPWSSSPRIMFFYHYSPSVIFLSILLAYQLFNPSATTGYRKFLYGTVAFIVFGFILIYPFITSLPFKTTLKLSKTGGENSDFQTVDLFFMTNRGLNPWTVQRDNAGKALNTDIYEDQ